jgi:bile acid-coenzyme A ligase
MSKGSYGRILTRLAGDDPTRVALVCEEDVLTRGELEQRANRMARAYAARGVQPGDVVTISLPNGVDFVIHCVATWKCGAVPNPISPRLPPPERAAIIARAAPALLVGGSGEETAARSSLPEDFEPEAGTPAEPPPDATPPHERVMATGGSTGQPKLIVLQTPAEYDPDGRQSILKPPGCVLVPGPLYHAAPFGSCTQGLLAGVEVVLMQRFDASRCLQLIERHRVEQVLFVPTMMHRISRLPEEERIGRDVSSLRVVFTGGSPCPPWLMRFWIEWLGPDVMHDIYGPSERIGGTHITGHEWLAHPGSVGKPTHGAQIRILDPATGRDVPTGEVGEVYMMPAGGRGSTYRYIGAEARATADGWESVGDMGYLDADGYLYLTDRRTDMILSGGRNIYPAQVEAALDAHPAVQSSAVIGMPDDDLGQRLHAIVQTSTPLTGEELREHLRELVVHYSIPRSFEFADYPLRDDAGKVRRWALREARVEAKGNEPPEEGGA